jgi:protein-arginine kinase activator protein McsA
MSIEEKWKEAGYRAVDEMVKKLRDEIDQEHDFQQISEIVKKEGQKVNQVIMQEIINTQGEKERTREKYVCQECGKTLIKQAQMRSRVVESLNGEIEVERPYFYCKGCKQGYQPYDEKMKIAPQRKQYDMQRAAAELFSEVPYTRASQIFERLTGMKISDHCMQEVASEMGKAADNVRVLPNQSKVEEIIEQATNGRVWRPVLVVAADGALMPTGPQSNSRSDKRGKGEWKEAKGFRIYLVCQDRIEQIMSWHKIANEEEFGKALSFASTLIPVEKVRIALLGDGAKWLWARLKEAFPAGVEILDYYHCSEHIHKMAQLQFTEQNQQALWIESTMAKLNFGEVESVVAGLQRMKAINLQAEDEIRKLISYLKTNSHRIDYTSFKRRQFPRGSGAIESANKFICHVRMKRSGAWWYQINGNKMLLLRCAFCNDTFDQLFARYKLINK